MLTKQSFDWLPSLSLNPVTRSVPWIACGYTGHIFSLEGNKYVIPSSPDDLPVVILVIYIYFICEKKKVFLVATSVINTDLICVRLLHVFSS